VVKTSKYLTAPTSWIELPIRIALIGAGGNGSEVIDILANLHFVLLRTGHKHGLAVTIFDDARVTDSNRARQRFWPCDVGQYKSVVLANRYNLAMGTVWHGVPERFLPPPKKIPNVDILITA